VQRPDPLNGARGAAPGADARGPGRAAALPSSVVLLASSASSGSATLPPGPSGAAAGAARREPTHRASTATVARADRRAVGSSTAPIARRPSSPRAAAPRAPHASGGTPLADADRYRLAPATTGFRPVADRVQPLPPLVCDRPVAPPPLGLGAPAQPGTCSPRRCWHQAAIQCQLRSVAVVLAARRDAVLARLESLLVPDVIQYVLLLVGWVLAFMLGKELQTGFAQWWQQRRSE
jgi:hypothetical protein